MKPHPFTLLLALVLLAVAVWKFEQFQAFGTGKLEVKPHPSDSDAIIFSWRGPVEAPMARRFREAFEDHRGEARRILIDLHSPGGSLAQGGDVIDEINFMKRTHAVDAYVGRRSRCLSMCVPIFLQGERRVASPTSRWMFHQPVFSDAVTGEEVTPPEFERRRSASRFVRRYLEPTDIDQEWLENLQKDWRRGDVWKTGRELFDERSNIIQSLESSP